MKNINLIISMTILLLATSILSSCKKESAGTPSSSEMNLKLSASANSFAIPVQPGFPDKPTTGHPMIKWDVANLEVSRILFEAEKNGSEGSDLNRHVEYTWSGPAMVDLFNVNAIIGKILIPPGTYNAVQLTVIADKNTVSDHPDFYLSGNYTNSMGTVIPIIISVNENLWIRTEVKNMTLTVNGISPNSWNINLILQKMFSSISQQDLDGIALTDGRIIISSVYNTQLYEKILVNLEKIGGTGLEEAG